MSVLHWSRGRPGRMLRIALTAVLCHRGLMPMFNAAHPDGGGQCELGASTWFQRDDTMPKFHRTDCSATPLAHGQSVSRAGRGGPSTT